MSVLYNDNDRFCIAWLGELIRRGHLPEGRIDGRSVEELKPQDCAPTSHFFAGIGGWPYSLRLAGWPPSEPIWTGSCPCQPFSAAGKRLGTADRRHLWPAWLQLIRECHPPTIFGEQVASRLGRQWLAGVRADLEVLGYAVGAADLCACSVGTPHKRQRLYFFANSAGGGRERIFARTAPQVSKDGPFKALGAWNSTGNPFWNWKEQLAETRIDRMDDGVSSTVVIRPALRGFGNAIVPQVAAAFVRAAIEALEVGLEEHDDH